MTPADPIKPTDITDPAFSVPHPIVNENTASSSGKPAFHLTETASAQYPIHISRSDLAATNISPPLPLFEETQSPAPSTHSDNFVSENPRTPPPAIISKPTLLRKLQVHSSPLLVIRVISHSSTLKPNRYKCQISTNVFRTDIGFSTRLLAAYRQTVATKSHENPHMRLQGRPDKEKGTQMNHQQIRIRIDKRANGKQKNDFTGKRHAKRQQLIRSGATQRVIDNANSPTTYHPEHPAQKRIENVQQFRHVQTEPLTKMNQSIAHLP